MTLCWEVIVHNLATGEYATFTVESKDCLGAEGEALRRASKQWPRKDLEVDKLRLIDGFEGGVAQPRARGIAPGDAGIEPSPHPEHSDGRIGNAEDA